MNNIADELDSASQAPGTIGSDRAVSAADRIFNLAYNCDVKKINDICQDIDLSETNQFGANVLHCLIRSKKQDKKKDTYWALMKRLSNDEQKKSLITQNDNDGYSPLDKAAFEGDSITLKLMLKTILNLSTEIPKIQKDRTLLHSAAAGGHISSLRIILEEAGKAWRKKTDKAMLKNKIQTFLDEQDLDGNTALHLAAIYRHWSAVDFLIDRGCSLTILNNKGDPPLNYCLKLSRSNESLIKRLDSSIQYITRRQDHRVKRTKLKMNFTTLVSHDKGSHKLGRETSAIGLAMISGEYGYSEKYALLEDGFAKSLFLIVVFLLGIVLMAVFIGLSVRDASLLLNEGRYHLTKKNIQMIFIAEDFGKWLEALGICFVSEQLSIFNNLEEPSIEVSLKQATRKDLLFESKKWFQAHVQYYLFKIFGVTLQRSLLYRKFPISKILQDEIETFLVTKTPSQESFDPNSQI
ncbi:hypothetical protein QYM36_010004 [Artemia franciscana]|uniref:Uncharacterized protein n=1 Tax=Artemia franciscana TaxID=6661 RepID=A0AA88HW10_ARTSF|nr:hypothetical protein QYM36_010004 [Artemia franciscana]